MALTGVRGRGLAEVEITLTDVEKLEAEFEEKCKS